MSDVMAFRWRAGFDRSQATAGNGIAGLNAACPGDAEIALQSAGNDRIHVFAAAVELVRDVE